MKYQTKNRKHQVTLYRNLLLFIFINLFFCQFTFAKYSFSADVLDSDPCCIHIDAIASDPSNNYNWWVEVDGETYTYDDIEPNESGIVVCFETNSTHIVTFNVVGANNNPWWERKIELTECGGVNPCDECNLIAPNIILGQGEDNCLTVSCSAGNEGYTSPCNSPFYTWDFGDDSQLTLSGSTVTYTYENDGTYEVCLTYGVTNSAGEICDDTVCDDITIENCTPCCGFEMEPPILEPSPFPMFPCLGRISIPRYSYNGECAGYDLIYDYGDGNTGTSQFHFYSGSGPYTVCVTMSSGDCELKMCSQPTYIPNCTTPKLNEVDFRDDGFSFYPNPVNNYIEIINKFNSTKIINSIEILNINGQILSTNFMLGAKNLRIDLTSLQKGVYFIQATNEEGYREQKKFVKVD